MFSNEFRGFKNVECGLVRIFTTGTDRSKKEPIPLVSVNIAASVVHAVAQVELTQVYVNKEEEPIEAIYYFPVDSNGAVTHFHAELEGRTIQGIVKPHEEAEAQYEKAIKDKQTAFLVESNKPDIFKVRVGFLKPGSQVKIVIGYVTEVKNEKGSSAIRFFIPTTVAPRYISPSETDEKAEDLKNMTFARDSPAPLSVIVNVAIQGEIKSIESPTHQIQIQRNGTVPEKETWSRAVVNLSGHVTDMDRDFVILIVPQEIHVPRLYAEKLENSTAFMTHLIPSFNLDEQRVELIFVLDRSGSMDGASINLARKALNLFLHSMPADCYFNIVGFGSSFEFFFPNSVKYDDGSLKKAILHSKGVTADLGGTEILEPLEAIFSKKPIRGYFRQIFVLTDGEVSDTERVIGICEANAQSSRVFALGIGDGASHHLVEGMAEAGRGTAVFVTYNEPIDSKVLQQLKNATQPSLTDVRIKWTGLPEISTLPVDIEINKEKTLCGYGTPVSPISPKKFHFQAPEKIKPIFDGSQLVVFGIFPAEVPTGVEIVAESADGPLAIQIQVSEENDVGSTGMVHKLAAIKTLSELEMKMNGLKYSSRSYQYDPAEEEELKKQIVTLACQHGLASSLTSFVAVDTEWSSDDNWVMQSRYVPSQYTNGWHDGIGRGTQIECLERLDLGVEQLCEQFRPNLGSARMCAKKSKGFGFSNPFSKLFSKSSKKFSPPEFTSASNFLLQNPQSRKTKEEDPKDLLQALVATQSFDGSFSLNQAFSDAIGKPLEILMEGAKSGGWDEGAWATSLAITYMNLEMNDSKESWELLEIKARKWLKENFEQEVETILAAAEACLKSP